jgi:hypothetical protein
MVNMLESVDSSEFYLSVFGEMREDNKTSEELKKTFASSSAKISRTRLFAVRSFKLLNQLIIFNWQKHFPSMCACTKMFADSSFRV